MKKSETIIPFLDKLDLNFLQQKTKFVLVSSFI